MWAALQAENEFCKPYWQPYGPFGQSYSREEGGELLWSWWKLLLCFASGAVVIREQPLSLQKHYRNAMKLEKNGDKYAERLFAQVTMDEARRELESARKDLNVAQNALKVLLECGRRLSINPVLLCL